MRQTLSHADRRAIVAEIIAQLAHTQISPLVEPVAPPATYDALHIDYAARSVAVHGAPVKLQPREFDVLAALTRNRQRTLSQEALLRLCWPNNGEDVEGYVVPVVICKLRRKLGPAVAANILTSQGHGYRFFVADHL